MPTYRVIIGESPKTPLGILVVGDSPEGVKRTCERAGLVVVSVDHTPWNTPAAASDEPMALLQDELRQVRAKVDVMSVELKSQTGVGTVFIGCMIAMVFWFVVQLLWMAQK